MKHMHMDIKFRIQTDDDISEQEIYSTLKMMINKTIPIETKDFVITDREFKVTDKK